MHVHYRQLLESTAGHAPNDDRERKQVYRSNHRQVPVVVTQKSM